MAFAPNPNHAIHSACREGHLSEVESLLSANPKLSATPDDDGRLPFHWAVSYNHLEILEVFMARRDFDVDAQDGLGWTALMMAASLPNGEGEGMLDLLLGRGADVKITNHLGQTALHFCTSKNNLDEARKLIANGASARIKDRRGQLPLHRASAIGSVPLIKLLLENKSPVNATDSAGQTALHHAISEGHGDAALVLLKAGAETDKKDSDGNLAINLAPDTKVRKFVLQSAEREGIDIVES